MLIFRASFNRSTDLGGEQIEQIADLAASFQEAVVDCLVGKAFLALKKTGFNTLCCGGGVAANAASAASTFGYSDS